MKKSFVAASVLALASALVSSSATAQVNVKATTTGCFYTSVVCTVGGQSAFFSDLLGFVGGSFDVTVGPGAMHNFDGTELDNIGKLTLLGSPATLGNVFLRVFVTFQSPTLGNPNDIAVADFNFLDNNNDARLLINFDDEYHTFQYGPNVLQMFKFRGATGEDPILHAGQFDWLGFRVDCVRQGTAACLAPPPGVEEFSTTTPEPSTYALMAAGLLGLAGAARRRNRSAK